MLRTWKENVAVCFELGRRTCLFFLIIVSYNTETMHNIIYASVEGTQGTQRVWIHTRGTSGAILSNGFLVSWPHDTRCHRGTFGSYQMVP